MKFSYEETIYELDLDLITFDEAIAIQSELGITLGTFINGVNSGEGDPRALKALLWLGKNQAGEACRLKDLGAMVPFKLGLVREPAPPAESQESERAADPTLRGGKTRGRRTSATS